jgi:hypothetical protein
MRSFWPLAPLLAAALGCTDDADTVTTVGRNPAQPTYMNATPEGGAGGNVAAGASTDGEGGSGGTGGASMGGSPSGGGAAGASLDEEPGSSGAGGATARCEPGSPVLAKHLTNARDLGGLPLPGGERVGCGVVFRGPPLSLSNAGCDEAARLGLKTLIDLRVAGERNARPDAACVDAQRVHAPLPVPYGLGPSDYLADLHETASIALAFRALGNPAAYPVYLHCTYGRDRTGVVIALWLLVLGASRDTVMQDYLLSATSVGAYPDSLAAVLDEVEARGGAEVVLRDAGITTEELAVMRQMRTER